MVIVFDPRNLLNDYHRAYDLQGEHGYDRTEPVIIGLDMNKPALVA